MSQEASGGPCAIKPAPWDADIDTRASGTRKACTTVPQTTRRPVRTMPRPSPPADGDRVMQTRRRGRSGKSRSEAEIVEWWKRGGQRQFRQKPPRCKGAGTCDPHPRIPAGVGCCSHGRAFGMCHRRKKALIQARRSRFPKNFEREAEVHQRTAAMVTSLVQTTLDDRFKLPWLLTRRARWLPPRRHRRLPLSRPKLRSYLRLCYDGYVPSSGSLA
jgi:hypothetical protein